MNVASSSLCLSGLTNQAEERRVEIEISGFYRLTIGQQLVELPALTLQTFLHLHDVLLQEDVLLPHVFQAIHSGGTKPSVRAEISLAQHILSEAVHLKAIYDDFQTSRAGRGDVLP